MKRISPSVWIVSLFFLSAGATRPTKAQEPGIPGDPREQIMELFRKIEKDLQEIDKLLLEAGNSATAEKASDAAKSMEELLRRTMEGQKRVSESIEEILQKLPPDNQGQGSSPPPQSPPPDSSEPGSSGERPREKTPLEPGQMPPESPKDSETEERSGKNIPSPPPQSPPPDPAKHSEYGGKWGELPPLYQELFRNQKTDDVPVRYRRWIEDYYRRVSRTKP